MYVEKYECYTYRGKIDQLLPGKCKVAVDVSQNHVIGYGYLDQHKKYILCPFIEPRPHLGENKVERVKFLITGNSAMVSVPIEERDALNDLFFKPIGSRHLRTVKVMDGTTF